MPQAIAAFDLDHTLLKISGSFHFGSYLYAHKIFSFFSMCRLVSYYCRHKTFGLSLQEIHHKSFEVLFKNQPLSLFQYHARIFVDSMSEKMFYSPVIERLRALQDDGVYIVILSSSPDFLVKCFAERLGVNESQGSCYDVDKEGRLCTISCLMEGKEKADYCFSLAARLGVPRDSLQVYSDSYLDLPFLEAAGKAVAVNPDKKLCRMSQERNWEIL